MAKNDHFYRQKGANPNQKEQILTDFDGRLPAIMHTLHKVIQTNFEKYQKFLPDAYMLRINQYVIEVILWYQRLKGSIS